MPLIHDHKSINPFIRLPPDVYCIVNIYNAGNLLNFNVVFSLPTVEKSKLQIYCGDGSELMDANNESQRQSVPPPQAGLP